MSSRFSALLDREDWLGRILIAPAILYIVALIGIPFFLALYYSVTDITVGTRSYDFVGLENFRTILGTRSFRTALWNTIVFTVVSQIIVLVLAKVLALTLLKDFPGKWIVRLLILLPWVAPISLGAIGWLWIFDSIYSVLNWTLQAVHILGPNEWPIWLGTPTLAMTSVILVHVWRMLPLATVILLGGLSSIPQDINDAAAVDGAGFWRKLFEITIPMMLPIIAVAGLFGIVFTFTDMIVIYILTRGGPYDTTQVLASLAFFTGVQGGNLGEGAAIALFLFPVMMAVAILILLIARRSETT